MPSIKPQNVIPIIQRSIQRMFCEGCGAEANARCNCGKPYVPAKQRVAEYDKINPGQSTRQAAADLGVDNATVHRARNLGVADATPKTITGRDGKTYQSKRVIDREEEHYNAVNRRRVFDKCAADVIRKAEQGAGLIEATSDEIDDEVIATLDRVIETWIALRKILTERKNQNG